MVSGKLRNKAASNTMGHGCPAQPPSRYLLAPMLAPADKQTAGFACLSLQRQSERLRSACNAAREGSGIVKRGRNNCSGGRDKNIGSQQMRVKSRDTGVKNNMPRCVQSCSCPWLQSIPPRCSAWCCPAHFACSGRRKYACTGVLR